MADVARHAGVSVASVSRVINHHPHVTDETQLRVKASMAELGYVANSTARALAGGRTQVIGLLTQEVQNPFSYSVISGVDEAVSQLGYDFLLCTTHARREKEAEYVARLSRGMVDGLLIKSASLGSPGIEQIRWVQPVRPGDTLTARVTVLESRPSQSKPDRGTLKIRTEVTNQRGEQVMWMENFGMFGRRPAAG